MRSRWARPGYAVGSMAIRGGGPLDGFSVTFRKLEGKGLSVTESYRSEWLGRKGVAPRQDNLGEGRLIVGIHGKLAGAGDDEGVCTIGLLVVGDRAKPK